jgi:hypothetical protein
MSVHDFNAFVDANFVWCLLGVVVLTFALCVVTSRWK